MNKAEKLLRDKLKPILSPMGFKWVQSRGMFVRREKYGFSAFFWTSFTTHEEGGRLELIPFFVVRHNIVEDVVNQLDLIYGDDNKRYTPTVCRGLGYFPIQKDKQYIQYVRLASAEADIENVAYSFESVLADDGKAFFERYSSLKTCSQDLNNPIESRNHPLYNNFARRAYYGVATAWFSERESVACLVEGYRQFAMDSVAAEYDEINMNMRKLIGILHDSSAN